MLMADRWDTQSNPQMSIDGQMRVTRCGPNPGLCRPCLSAGWYWDSESRGARRAWQVVLGCKKEVVAFAAEFPVPPTGARAWISFRIRSGAR